MCGVSEMGLLFRKQRFNSCRGEGRPKACCPTKSLCLVSFSLLATMQRLQARLILAAVNFLGYLVVSRCGACLKCFASQLHMLRSSEPKPAPRRMSPHYCAYCKSGYCNHCRNEGHSAPKPSSAALEFLTSLTV